MPDHATHKVTSTQLIALADEIDRRIGPLSGRIADKIAIILRAAADQLDGIRHPTGSETFAAKLEYLGAAAPWYLDDEDVGSVLSVDGRTVCTADTRVTDRESTALAMWIICAVNTLAGFAAVVPQDA